MKLFISYKGEDFDEVQNTIEQLRDISPDIQVSTLRRSIHWKNWRKNIFQKLI